MFASSNTRMVHVSLAPWYKHCHTVGPSSSTSIGSTSRYVRMILAGLLTLMASMIRTPTCTIRKSLAILLTHAQTCCSTQRCLPRFNMTHCSTFFFLLSPRVPHWTELFRALPTIRCLYGFGRNTFQFSFVDITGTGYPQTPKRPTGRSQLGRYLDRPNVWDALNSRSLIYFLSIRWLCFSRHAITCGSITGSTAFALSPSVSRDRCQKRPI